MPRSQEAYTFFWKANQLHGWACQWYPSPFTATIDLPEATEVTFPTAEHWMMVQKALLFGDVEVAKEVIGIEGSSAAECRAVKDLGRKVKGFDEEVWVRERERIVVEGSILKFEQNKELKQKLMDTGESVLVEASPRDKIWGIGLGETKAKLTARSKEGWGLNLLGVALMKARNEMRLLPDVL